MARIRTIKPDFWDSPDTAKASYRTRLFYIAMWNWADDWGIGVASPKQLVAFAFPNDDDVSPADYPSLAKEVADCFGVVFYMVAERPYYCIPAWDKHPRTERKAVRVNPTPDMATSLMFTGKSEAPTLAAEEPSLVKEERTPEREREREKEREGERERGLSLVATDRVDVVAIFNVAYDFWPKRVKREEALEKFRSVVKVEPAQEIADAIQRFGTAYAATTQKQYVPALGVWLNQRRWSDELPTSPEVGRKASNGDRNMNYVQQLQREAESDHRGELTA
jgi:hypothetical protein